MRTHAIRLSSTYTNEPLLRTNQADDISACLPADVTHLAVVEVGNVGRRVAVRADEGRDERHRGRWGRLLGRLGFGWEATPATLQAVFPHD